ncbi:DUF4184 family protein [Pontibacter sp. MBLB2868]|uniref:DUF4184 family protein n=1 Tax=Pontibacter sp. MBLB2868 TaxID=3451555 RepID=UPI003F7533BA
MPFTAAHPALVLPLKQIKSNWFSTTGLVIGSIAPDFGYFLSFLLQERISSHNLQDIFIFNLPVTVLLTVLFHGFVRDNLIRHLPPLLRKRAEVAEGTPWFGYLRRHWLIFLTSAVIGIVSHLFWDSFTHLDGYVVNHMPFLLQHVEVFGIGMQVSRLIQHTSTVVGLIVILLYTLRLPAYPLKRAYNWVGYWVLVLVGGLLLLQAYMPDIVIMKTIDELVVRFVTGCLSAVLLLGVLAKFTTQKQES